MAATTTNTIFFSFSFSFSFFFFFFFFFTLTSGSLPTLPSSPLASMITAPPSYHLDTPKFPAEPPVLSPDVMPVFPSPRRGSGSVSFPTIPSSQSPPNPDLMDPDSAFAPFGSSSAAMATGDAPSEIKYRVGFWWVSIAAIIALVWWV